MINDLLRGLVGGGGGGGATAFIGLTDTPAAYGAPGQAVLINGAGTGLIFGPASGFEPQVTRTLFVDKNRTDAYVATGAIAKPFKTLTDAMTYIGTPTNIAEQKERYLVLIASGEYDENLVVPGGRVIELVGLGPWLLGDGAGANFTSTTPRNLIWNNDSSVEFGGCRPTLKISALRPSESSTTHPAYGTCASISGNLIVTETAGATTSELHLDGVKVFGNFDTSGKGGILNTYLYRSYFPGTYNSPSANIIIAESCEWDNTVIVNSYSRIERCEIPGMTVNSVQDYLPPHGLIGCNISGTFTGPAGSFVCDGVTKWWWENNVGVFAGGATLVLKDSSGASTFLDLSDTPLTYDTDIRWPHTNDAGTALEWGYLDNLSYIVNRVAHGFVVGDAYGDEIGTLEVNWAGHNQATGIVTRIIDADNFVVTSHGRVNIPAHGFSPGSSAYNSAAFRTPQFGPPLLGDWNPIANNCVKYLYHVLDADYIEINIGTPIPIDVYYNIDRKRIVDVNTTPYGPSPDTIYLVDTSSGPISLMLITGTPELEGSSLTVKIVNASNPVSISIIGGTGLVEGVPVYTMGALNETATFVLHGNDYYII